MATTGSSNLRCARQQCGGRLPHLHRRDPARPWRRTVAELIERPVTTFCIDCRLGVAQRGHAGVGDHLDGEVGGYLDVHSDPGVFLPVTELLRLKPHRP